MSAQFRLVSACLEDIRIRADIQGLDDRHPTAELLRFFNESAQQLQLRKVNLGFEGYLTGTAPASLSVTAPVTGETYTEESWPLDASHIHSVHVLATTGLWVPLKPISIAGIRDYQVTQSSSFYGTQGMPLAFALRQAPFGAASVETVGKIVIVPKPTVVRQFRIFYLQNWADIADTATFNGMSGDIEWIIWDCVAKISAKDNDSQSTYSIATIERDRIEKMFASSVPRTQMGSSIEPRRATDDDFYDLIPRAL